MTADEQILAGLSILVLPSAVLPPGGLELMAIAKIGKSGELGVGHENDAAARTPVPAVGSSAGLVGLPAERGATVAPVAGL